MTYFIVYLAIGAIIGIVVVETIRSHDVEVRWAMALVTVSALFWPYIVAVATYGALKRE